MYVYDACGGSRHTSVSFDTSISYQRRHSFRGFGFQIHLYRTIQFQYAPSRVSQFRISERSQPAWHQETCKYKKLAPRTGIFRRSYDIENNEIHIPYLRMEVSISTHFFSTHHIYNNLWIEQKVWVRVAGKSLFSFWKKDSFSYSWTISSVESYEKRDRSKNFVRRMILCASKPFCAQAQHSPLNVKHHYMHVSLCKHWSKNTYQSHFMICAI